MRRGTGQINYIAVIGRLHLGRSLFEALGSARALMGDEGRLGEYLGTSWSNETLPYTHTAAAALLATTRRALPVVL